MSDEKPQLIGGNFTPSWHKPSCICRYCNKMKDEFNKTCEQFKKWENQAEEIAKFEKKIKKLTNALKYYDNSAVVLYDTARGGYYCASKIATEALATVKELK